MFVVLLHVVSVSATRHSPTPPVSLIEACLAGEKEYVRKFLSEEEHLDKVKGFSALCAAIVHDRTDIVAQLIREGANVNIFPDESPVPNSAQNPIFQSLLHGRVEILRYLLDHGAYIDVTQKGATPLMYAIDKDMIKFAIELMDRGANIDAVDSEGRSVLDRAIQHGNEELITELQLRGAKTVSQNNFST